MDVEQSVAQHYAHQSLEQAIVDALAASGKDPDRLTAADLAPVDEFHIGGRQATIDFATEMGIAPERDLLDVGCGIGGAARYFAGEQDCRVTGIDLTDNYIRTARALSRRVGLDDRISFEQTSATALPFAAARFDGAYMLHVGMNIEDKAQVFAAVRRVLKPGAVFGIYDVMRLSGSGELSFPVPWASGPDTSFVESADRYRAYLESAGFRVEKVRDRHAFAIAFFDRMRAAAAKTAPPPLGLHIVMGPATTQKIANMIENLERGLIAPTEIVARAI